MNYTDFIRLSIIAYILYKLLLLKTNEKYTQKLLHKGDKHLTRITDRQNYKADLYEENKAELEQQKEKAINEAFKYAAKEVAYFRPDDSDNVHYPLKRHFQLHELMGGKCIENIDVKDVHKQLTQFKIDKLAVKNNNLAHTQNNHNGMQSFTRDHIQYVNDSPLTTGIIKDAQFTAFDADAQNIESVQAYYQNIEKN